MNTTDFVWFSSLSFAFMLGYLLGLRDKKYFYKKHVDELSQQIVRMKQAGFIEEQVSKVQFNQPPEVK